MTARFDFSAFEWLLIENLLPTKIHGTPRVEDRRVLNEIFSRPRTGASRADISSRYEPEYDLCKRFNRWRKASHWARILQAV